MGHLPPLPFIVQPMRWWEGRAELQGNYSLLGIPHSLEDFPGWTRDLGGLLQPKWLCGSEIVARLTTWEGMQTRMKASKPYLLDLIDLGGKGKKQGTKLA